MPLAVGTKLSRYEIRSKIGEGGMGEVYLAVDTELDRTVAVKVLPTDFADNQQRMQRFIQEAKAASALNHPHILTIYEIGSTQAVKEDSSSASETRFIAMEFIDGETLRERMRRGRLNLSDVLEVASQAAGALAAAHAAGIIHRDIKPENIMVRRDGYIKVLDFGLAKLTEPEGSTTDTEAQTKALINTGAGTVMGTANYMSPEQARGKRVDAGTDLWSLGAVIYEMITGHVPFEADTPSEVIGLILNKEPPPLARYEREAPPELERIVTKALTKDREERYQSAKDLSVDLKRLKRQLDLQSEIDRTVPPDFRTSDSNAHARVTSTQSRDFASAGTSHGDARRQISSAEYIASEIKRHKTGVAVTLTMFTIALAGIGLGLFSFFRQHQPKSQATSLRIIPLTSFPGRKAEPAFSPDGNEIAFVWNGGSGDNLDIYVKLIDGGTPLRLTNNPAPDQSPCWSPDGRRIAFVRNSKAEGGLYIIPALGGPERKVASFNSPLDTTWSPDGQQMAVTDQASSQEPRSIFLVSVENGEKRKLPSPSAQFDNDRAPKFSPDGQMLAFIHSPNFLIDDIYIVPAAGGTARRLTFDNRLIEGLAWSSEGQEIIFSSNRGGQYGLWRISVSGGQPEPLPAVGENASQPFISRQGNRLAYTYTKVNRDIWQAPGPNSTAKNVTPRKFIASTREDVSPEYSPDGRKIAFISNRAGSMEVWVGDSDGQNPIQLTNFGPTMTGTPRWSPDNRYIAFDSRAEGSSDIYLISADGGKPRRLTTEPSADITPVWSKDGRWIYFGSDRGGDFQIWKIPSQGGEAVQVTRQGGYGTLVSSDDKYMYYSKRSEPGVWRVPVDGGEEARIFDKGGWGETVVLNDGICFLDRETTRDPTINFFSYATRRVTQLATIEKAKYDSGPPNLTVSPDGEWVLYWQQDQLDTDIMLVENLR